MTPSLIKFSINSSPHWKERKRVGFAASLPLRPRPHASPLIARRIDSLAKDLGGKGQIGFNRNCFVLLFELLLP